MSVEQVMAQLVLFVFGSVPLFVHYADGYGDMLSPAGKVICFLLCAPLTFTVVITAIMG